MLPIKRPVTVILLVQALPAVQSSPGASAPLLCHACRWALAQQDKHPEIKRFCTEALHAVERWHFDKNHVGIWCDKNVNPRRLNQLQGVNQVICEQRFRHVNRYAGAFRQMKRERFQWMLLMIAEMDHEFRSKGLLGPKA